MQKIKPKKKPLAFEATWASLLVEPKFKLRQKHLHRILRKPETFRENFPEYTHLNVYLGVAALIFDPVAEKEYIDKGIAIIKQVGDTVVILDEHLKIF